MSIQPTTFRLDGSAVIPCPEGFKMTTTQGYVIIEGHIPDTPRYRNRFIRIRFPIREHEGETFLRQTYATVYQEYEISGVKWVPKTTNSRWPGEYVPTGKWKKNKPKYVLKRMETVLVWMLNGFR